MENLIKKHKSLTTEVGEVEETLGEKLIPIVRILNSDKSKSVIITEDEIIRIRKVEIRDEDILVMWETDWDDTGYNVVPFSIFDTEDYVENVKNLIKNRAKNEYIKRLERARSHFENSKKEVAHLEEKLKENI